MIVRIMGEGQYRVGSALLDQINDADNGLVLAVADEDVEGFRRLYLEMLDLVRTQGTVLSPEEIQSSDVILPPPDIDFEEAKALFVGEGLIPG